MCNKRVIESLIKAGAFDSLGHPRKGLVLIHEQAIDTVIDVKRNEAMGQDSLFGGDAEIEASFEVPVPDGEWDKSTLLGFEREMLGLYVSDHPLLGIEHILSAATDCSVAQLLGVTAEDAERGAQGERSDGQQVTVGGILSGVQRKVTRQGMPWAAATLEDLEGAVEVLFFPATYAECAAAARRRRDRDREGASRPPRRLAQAGRAGGERARPVGRAAAALLWCRCRCSGAWRPVVDRLHEVLRSHPGLAEVHLRLFNGRRTTVVRLDDKLRVKPSPGLLADLKQLLGPACVG